MLRVETAPTMPHMGTPFVEGTAAIVDGVA